MVKYLFLSAGIFLFTALLSVGGAWEEFDLWMLDQRMANVEILPDTDVVIVGIDAKTLRTLNEWPISRSRHAKIVDRLVADGAKQIAFDIDLSASRSPQADVELAAAFKRADGRIILPIFFHRDSGKASGISVTRPRPVLAKHAWLANVNVSPEKDGRIRQASYGVWLDGQFYMSLPAMLAGRANRQNLFFYTNYSIRPDLIPHVSYVDLLDGKVDPKVFAGKKVIIGATAVELGDQFAVPAHGIMSGPTIQAMAYETLATGNVVKRPAVWFTISVLFVLLLAGGLLSRGGGATKMLFLGGATLVVIQIASFFLFKWYFISLDTAAWSVAIALLCVAVAVSEIFDQKRQIQQEKFENEYRSRVIASVMSDSPDAIVIADETGLVEMINSAAERFFGLPGGNVLPGMQLTEILPQDLVDSIKAADTFPQEFILERNDGSEVCLQYTATCSQITRRVSRGRSFSRDLLTYRFHDVTERHLAEQATRDAHRKEQEASRAKTEFIANMGHELRTPLNAVIGFSELMKSEIYGPMGDERYREYAADIMKSGKRLLEVVNDVLDLSRLDSGKVKVEEELVTVGDAVNACLRIADSWEEAAEHRLTFHAEAAYTLRADPAMFKKMLINLLSNAVKFSAAGSEVAVRVTSAPEGSLYVSVSDSGMGIAEEDVEKLSVPFFQVDSSLARAKEGTGLGLTLVNGYMALHGGHLAIESELDVGTTVSLVFPAARVGVPEGEQADQVAAS